jgi:hypothetical protein
VRMFRIEDPIFPHTVFFVVGELGTGVAAA